MKEQAGGRSIRQRLVTTVCGTTLAALLAASLAFVTIELVQFRHRMTRDAITLADVIGLNSSAGLVFMDPSHAERVLTALGAQPRVRAAAIFDADGRAFASWLQDGDRERAIGAPREAGSRFQGNELEVARDIVADGETVGRIVLRLDASEWADKAWQYLAIVSTVMVGAGLFSLAAAARLRSQISTPLSELVDGAGRLARGDLSVEFKADNRDELGELAAAFNAMAQSWRDLVGRIREDTLSVAEVSTTVESSSESLLLQVSRQDRAVSDSRLSIEKIGDSIAEVAANVEGLSETANDTSSSVVEMDASIAEVASHMDHLSSTIEETASTVSEMTAAVAQISRSAVTLDTATEETVHSLRVMSESVSGVQDNARICHDTAERTRSEAEQGLASVQETISSMREIEEAFAGLEQNVSRLAEKSQSIGEVVKVIEGVVSQTNLLALNASIIASHAGEHGRAFAVVAREVQNLADTTASSTREIEQIILDVQGDMGAAVEAVKEGSGRVQRGARLSSMAGEVLRGIAESSRESAEMVGSIVESSASQAGDIQRLDSAMRQVKDMVAQIARATAEQDNASSEITRGVDRIRAVGEEVKRSAREQSKQSRLITTAVEEVAERLAQIAEAAAAQKRGGEQIRSSLDVFRDVTDESSRRAEELRAVVETLASRSRALEGEMERFRV